MGKKIFLVFSMLLITSLFIGFASATPKPSAFYGEVTFQGNPVPNGYTIITEINGVENVKCPVIDGKYGYGSNACIVTYNGEDSPTIDFYIQELEIGSYLFEDKEITKLDFSLSYLPELPESITPSNGGSTGTSASGGGGGGGSGGGGGGGATTSTETTTTSSTIEGSEESCVENWVCGPWSDSDNSCGTRICRDANECGTELSKPSVEKSCFFPYNVFSWLTGAVTGGTGFGSTGTGFLWILVIILVGAGLFILLSTKNQNKK